MASFLEASVSFVKQVVLLLLAPMFVVSVAVLLARFDKSWSSLQKKIWIAL